MDEDKVIKLLDFQIRMAMYFGLIRYTRRMLTFIDAGIIG